MSRHRNLKNIIREADDEYDEEYEEEDVVEPMLYANTSHVANVIYKDAEIMKQVYEQVCKVVDPTDFPKAVMETAIRENNYDVEMTIEFLFDHFEALGSKTKKTPKASPKTTPKVSPSTSSKKITSRAGASVIKVIPMQKNTNSKIAVSLVPMKMDTDSNQPGLVTLEPGTSIIYESSSLNTDPIDIPPAVVDTSSKNSLQSQKESGIYSALSSIPFVAPVEMEIPPVMIPVGFGFDKSDNPHAVHSNKQFSAITSKVVLPEHHLHKEHPHSKVSADPKSSPQGSPRTLDPNAKPTLNVVVIGHVDAGKSTMMGHVLYKLGKVTEREFKQLQHEANSIGKGSFAFAWVLDSSQSERNRGVTVSVANETFSTPHRVINLLDAPGHRDFVPAMIGGASQADIGLLVVDATPSGFEDGFVGGQTREHVILARSMGISELIIAVNKMDLVQFSETRFNTVKQELISFLQQSGFKETSLHFIPVSGYTGENLVKCTIDWYKGSTLLEMLDIVTVPERSTEKPFRFIISDINPSKSNVICGGRIETGSISVGEKVLLMPVGETVLVKALGNKGGAIKVGFAGDILEITLTGMSETSVVHVGQVLCLPNSPVPIVSAFEARLLTLDFNIPILPGTQVDLMVHSVHVPAHIITLLGTGKKDYTEKAKPRHISKNSVALVEIECNPMCLELHKDIKGLGRFSVRRNGSTIAVGIVQKIIR